MPQLNAIVAAAVGLHARPAATFVKAVADSGQAVTIAKPGQPPVDASSILRVMTLGVKHGDTVELRAEGPGAEAVLESLVALLETDLDG
jgi:phosphocarrier protein